MTTFNQFLEELKTAPKDGTDGGDFRSKMLHDLELLEVPISSEWDSIAVKKQMLGFISNCFWGWALQLAEHLKEHGKE